MSRCSRLAWWTAASATELLADVDRFAGAQTPFVDTLLECLSLDQVHPEADASVVAIGAVHHDDVGMTDVYELAGLVEDFARRRAFGRLSLEEFERARMIEPGIEGLEHFTVGALADLSDEQEMAPALNAGIGHLGGGRLRRGLDGELEGVGDLRTMDVATPATMRR